jgi:hypothetical protein
MKKICKEIFLFLLFMIPLFSYTLWDRDIMSEVFQPAKEKQGVIYIWDDKQTVWHSLLRKSSWYSFWNWFYQEAPLIVKIVYIILRITVVLSITMIIFYGIKFMIQVFNWSELKSATAKKDLINVLIWLLIAMFSITAITLVTSLAKSTFTSNDFWFINWWSYWNLKYNELSKNLI